VRELEASLEGDPVARRPAERRHSRRPVPGGGGRGAPPRAHHRGGGPRDGRDARAVPPARGIRTEPRPGGQDEELLAVAKDVTARGFEAPPGVFDGLFATGLRADGTDLWLAYVDGEPVSTALGQVIGDAVGIFDVATPPSTGAEGMARG